MEKKPTSDFLREIARRLAEDFGPLVNSEVTGIGITDSKIIVYVLENPIAGIPEELEGVSIEQIVSGPIVTTLPGDSAKETEED